MKAKHPTILAIDSSDTPLKLALLGPDGKIRSARSFNIKQEDHAVKLSARLLAKCGLKLRDVEKVFVLRGPGRFTGIRIGLTMAALLREFGGAEVGAATVLETLAFQAARSDEFSGYLEKKPGGAIAAVTHAFRGEFFCQLFTAEKGRVSPIEPPRWVSADELKRYLSSSKRAVFCIGWAESRGPLAPCLPSNCHAALKQNELVPATLIAAALESKAEKKPVAPLYLKPARFELEKARKAGAR